MIGGSTTFQMGGNTLETSDFHDVKKIE
jgi:hypothetical protein